MATTQAQRQPSNSWAAGWTLLAAVMMVTAGGWWIMAGLVGFGSEDIFVELQEYALSLDVTAWSWILVAVGVLIVAAGIGLLGGAVWARFVGGVIAAFAMIAAFAWTPYYPLWGVLLALTSAFVLWALIAHPAARVRARR